MRDIRLVLLEVWGPLTNFLRRLGGEDGSGWLRETNKFPHKEKPWEKPDGIKIIEIGNYKDVEVMRTSLERSGAEICNLALYILRRIKLVTFKQSLSLVTRSAKELGFPQGASYKDICDAALKQGLYLCPAEVAPQLRLQYPDQQDGEQLVVATQPMDDSNDHAVLFIVARERDGRWLTADYRSRFYLWNGIRFVFALQRCR